MRGKILVLIGDYEHELMAANPELCSIMEPGFLHLRLVDEGSIGAAQVLESGLVAVNRQQGMLSRDLGVVERDVTLYTADGHRSLAQLKYATAVFSIEHDDGVSLHVEKSAAGDFLAF
jgi:hypothetical protein